MDTHSEKLVNFNNALLRLTSTQRVVIRSSTQDQHQVVDKILSSPEVQAIEPHEIRNLYFSIIKLSTPEKYMIPWFRIGRIQKFHQSIYSIELRSGLYPVPPDIFQQLLRLHGAMDTSYPLPPSNKNNKGQFINYFLFLTENFIKKLEELEQN